MAAEKDTVFDSVWMHILILIPIEFGLLHATPLGGMLVDSFHNIFNSLGFEFAAHAGEHAACCTLEHAAEEAAAETIIENLPTYSF